MKYETIIGNAILGKLSTTDASDMTTAKLLASKYIQCKYCGSIHDQSKICWLERNNGIIGVCCAACYDSSREMLQNIARDAKLEIKDSRTLPWAKKRGKPCTT